MPHAERDQQDGQGDQDARQLIGSPVHTERHKEQKEWKRVQIVTRAVLRESVREIKQARRHRDQHRGSDDRGLDSQETRPQSQNKRRAGENQGLAAKGRMEVWERGVRVRRHEEKRVEVADKVLPSKQLTPRRGKDEYTAVKHAVVANFVERDVHYCYHRAARYEPRQFTNAAPSNEKQRKINRPDERQIVARQRRERGEDPDDRRAPLAERLIERDQRHRYRDYHRHPPARSVHGLVPDDRARARKNREPRAPADRQAKTSEQAPGERDVERANDDRENRLVGVHAPDCREWHQQDRRQYRMKLIAESTNLRMLDVIRRVDVTVSVDEGKSLADMGIVGAGIRAGRHRIEGQEDHEDRD